MNDEMTSGDAVDEIAGLLGGDDGGAIDETPDAGAGDAQEADAEAEEVDDAGTGDSADEAADEDTAGEADDYLDIAELAAALGTSADALHVGDDGVVSVSATVRGQRSNVPLDEMRRSYQVQQVQDEKAHQLNQGIESAAQQRTDDGKRIEEQIAIANGVLQTLSEQIGAAMNAPDMDALRASNPGEYSARVADIQRQQGQFQQLQQQLGGVWQQQVAQRDTDGQAAQQQRLKRGVEAMSSFYTGNPKVPDVRDATGAQEVMQHLMAMGYTNEEIQQSFDPKFAGTPAIDHRVIQLASRSRYLQTIESGAKPAENKVKRMRKVLKPGASRSQAQKAQTDSLNAGKRFHKELSEKSAVDYIMQSGKL